MRTKLSRREFLVLAAGLAGGCQTANKRSGTAMSRERIVHVGPASNYVAEGVYSGFRNQGFFVVRQGEKLFALSAICTHRKCALSAEPDHSFYCKCHGSTFDAGGHVTRGPANRDLPVLSAQTTPQGQLVVAVPAR